MIRLIYSNVPLRVMIIAVDARPFQKDVASEYGVFLKELIIKLAQTYQLHQFILLIDSDSDPVINLPANVSVVTLTPKPTNLLLYKWWYDVKVSLALRKCRADIFIGTSGLCSLTTSVPQLLIIKDFSFLHYPAFFSKQSLSFYKKFTRRFLKKASLVAAYSDFIKKEIITAYKIPQQKIGIISSAANPVFKLLSWDEREKAKEKYAQGCEYFIFRGRLNPVGNLLNTLKAFSIFKKWQRTNMKLVVAINSEEYKDQAEKLSSYKYKNEVLLAENLTAGDLAQVTAGAYAMIFPPLYEGVGAAVLEALQCEVPAITSANSSMTELIGDAALYCNPEDPGEMAEYMKLIFKDEQLRSKLISTGGLQLKKFNPHKTASHTWSLIEQAVSR